MSWEYIYNFLGIKDFIYFISSPDIQDMLFPVKIIFVGFAMFFLAAVVYFMINSSYMQYQFLEDVMEFFFWQPYGLKEVSRRWKKIKERMGTGVESEYKLAIIEADDFLLELLEDREYSGKDFEEITKKIGKTVLPNIDQVKKAHEVRNSIVYNLDYKLDAEQTKKILDIYESAVNAIGLV
ncbi:MAG: hypothetical protein CEN87_537 [Parcubacteria group bacterium Licking1014_1]|nr:MAG: hypothetical protein CEN87_537 [Parcubacteria group bacterium Licking1014_1]